MLQKPKKNPLLPNNHRPISLLNSLDKIFESLYLCHLKTHTMPKIWPEQHGFRPNHSTTNQQVNLIDGLVTSANKRTFTAVVSLDVEKAFDKVWHEGLLYKLIKMNIPTQLVKIIKSFLSDRSFQVKIKKSLSTPKWISAGVPQGLCLSPHLFTIYINDMPQHPRSKIALFADDTLLHATSNSNQKSADRLQAQIDEIEPWFFKWKIIINPSKTTSVMFTHRPSTLTF